MADEGDEEEEIGTDGGQKRREEHLMRELSSGHRTMCSQRESSGAGLLSPTSSKSRRPGSVIRCSQCQISRREGTGEATATS
eukprot:86934-Rhodomonas_salina.2